MILRVTLPAGEFFLEGAPERATYAPEEVEGSGSGAC